MTKITIKYRTPNIERFVFYRRKWWQVWKDRILAEWMIFPGEIKTATAEINEEGESDFGCDDFFEFIGMWVVEDRV